MRAALVTGDETALLRPAHSLKSNSANVGATTSPDLTRSIEADARGGSVPSASERVAAVDTEFSAVRDALLAQRADRSVPQVIRVAVLGFWHVHAARLRPRRP